MCTKSTPYLQQKKVLNGHQIWYFLCCGADVKRCNSLIDFSYYDAKLAPIIIRIFPK